MDKNPYRALAAILRGIPEENRMLVAGVLREWVDGVYCGCAFGMAFPESQRISHGDLGHVYRMGDYVSNHPPMQVTPEERAYQEFYLWVQELGGDLAFVDDVISVNDNFQQHELSEKEEAQARYQHVLNWLDVMAGDYEVIQ